MALSNTTKTVAGLAVIGGLGLAVFRAQNTVADCVVNIPSTSRAVFPFCKSEAAGATPHCYVWPMRVGPRALYRLGRPSADAGVPYEYGLGYATLSQAEVNNAATLLPQVLNRLDLDDANSVEDTSAVQEMTPCPATPPRAAVLMPDDPLYDSGCRCGPGCQLDGAATVRGPSGHYDRIERGRWTVVDAPTCVLTPCTLASGSPFVAGACL